jgi:hypothetical protein
MTKKKIQPDDPAQAKRFDEAVRQLEDVGDLDRTEADKKFENALRRIVPRRQTKPAK